MIDDPDRNGRPGPTLSIAVVSGNFVITGLLAAVCVTLLRAQLFPSNDYAQYASGAENLLTGHGYATSLPFYDEHFHLGGLPVPQTVFPPGFSLLIAAGIAVGLSPEVSASFIAFWAFYLVAVTLYATARSVGLGRAAGLLLALSWCGFTVNWFNMLACLSEMPFTLATMLSLLAIASGQRDPRWRWNLLAGVGSAVAVLIRYAGVFHIASLFTYYALRCGVLRNRRSVADLVLGMALPCLTIGAMFGRNYGLVNDFKGGNDLAKSESLSAVVYRMIQATSEIVGIDRQGFMRLAPGEMLLVAWIGLAVVAVALARGNAHQGERMRFAHATSWPNLFAATYLVASVAALTWLECRTSIQFSFRMLMPLIPFALFVSANVAADVFMGCRPAWRRLLIGTAVLIFVTGQFHVYPARNLYHQRAIAALASMRSALRTRVGDQTLAEYLNTRVTSVSPLLANHPQTFGAVAGKPVVGLTPSYYSTRKWDDAEVEGLVQDYHVSTIIFLPGLWREDLEPAQHFFTQLARNQVPDWLTPLLRTPQVQVYEPRSTRPTRVPTRDP